MEFRKMVMITRYARQRKRHRYIEQSFGLCGKGWGWDDLGEWHWNMYNIIYETNHQSRLDAWYWMLGAGDSFHIWYYTCFNAILPNHPSPSPTESKRLFYISVQFLLSHIQGYRYHFSEFHIHALVYCIGVFFLAYFTHQNWFKCILFNGSVILHCVYVPHLSYPFICWWTSRLLPCPSYCKQCCNEHWGTCVSFNSGFFSVYAQQWDCWVIWQFYFQFFKESPHCSP